MYLKQNKANKNPTQTKPKPVRFPKAGECY